MARLSDINSTEKLLQVIRSKKDREPDTQEPQAVPTPPPRTGRGKAPSRPLISLQKPSTVGIDVGHDYLRVVRALETTGGKWELIERRRFALPPGARRDSPEFAAFLKSSLAAFCESARQSSLWAIMSAARVDVHHVRIPKVARKQIDNVVYWTAKRENPFDEKEMAFDFELQGEVIEQGIPKLAAMVYTAPRQEIEETRNLFAKIGWPLTGISIVPFAVQNLFRTGWIPVLEGTNASLFIGNDFSRIDLYSEGNLVMTRGIKAGMSSMVEALVDRLNETQSGPEAQPLTLDQGRKIVRSLSPDSPQLEETDPGFNLGKEAVFAMIEPALERLVRQVERTFEHYATTMPGDRIVRIFVSGAMNLYQPIVDYVGSQLGIESAVLDPLSNDESAACDLDGDSCVSERIAFGPALGLALSGNDHTPNLMFTYKDKEREGRVVRINRAVFAAFMATVLICAVIFTYQNFAISQQKSALAGLETRLAQFGPPVDRNQLLKAAAQVSQRRTLSRMYADRYLGMVLISEITALTPGNVRLLNLKIRLGPAKKADDGKPSQDPPKGQAEEVTAEGLILGERQLFETSLAGYVMSLESSPLFNHVTIQKNDVEPYLKKEALHFIINLKVEEQVHG